MKLTLTIIAGFVCLTLIGCGENTEEEECSCAEPGLKINVPSGQVSTILAGDIACQGASIECIEPSGTIGPMCSVYRVLPTSDGPCNVIAEYTDGSTKSKVVGFSYAKGCCTGYFTDTDTWDLTTVE